MQLRTVKWSPNAQIHINFTRKLEMLQSNDKSVSQSHAQEEQHHLSSCSVGKSENTNTFDKEPFAQGKKLGILQKNTSVYNCSNNYTAVLHYFALAVYRCYFKCCKYPAIATKCQRTH